MEKPESQTDFEWKSFYEPLKEGGKMYIRKLASSYAGEDARIQVKVALNPKKQGGFALADENRYIALADENRGRGMLADKNRDGDIDITEAYKMIETFKKTTLTGELITLSDILEQVGAAPVETLAYSDSKAPYKSKTISATGVKMKVNQLKDGKWYVDIYFPQIMDGQVFDPETRKIYAGDFATELDAWTNYDASTRSASPDSIDTWMFTSLQYDRGNVVIDTVGIKTIRKMSPLRNAQRYRFELDVQNLMYWDKGEYPLTVVTIEKKMQKLS